MKNRIHMRRPFEPRSYRARRLAVALGLALCWCIVGMGDAVAQPKSFTFGSPLRPNIMFGYKYVERVTERHEIAGQLVDSSTRILTYYVTEHQTIAPDGSGALAVEGNVDSMQVDVRGLGDPLFFNTQQIEHVSDRKLVAHRDVFASSTLVNRSVTFMLTPYGQILGVESPARKRAYDDINDGLIDPFTRERLREVLTDEYLASVYLPWRVLPLGRTVAYDAPQRLPFWAVFNRSSFRDTLTGTLVNGPDGSPHYTYRAQLHKPINTMVTVTGFEEPIKMGTMEASLDGNLKLDDDGVVLSGWTITKGTLTTLRNGMPVKSTISHEVYFDSMGMMPLATNE